MNAQTFPLAFGIKETGLPLILVEIKDKKLVFILDTGSNINGLDLAVYDYFKDLTEQVGEAFHFGVEGNKEEVITVKLPFAFEGHVFSPVFSVIDYSNAFSSVYEESGIPIHGILGNRFFMENKWIIDFDKLELCFGQKNI